MPTTKSKSHYLAAKKLQILSWERKGLIAFLKEAPSMVHNPRPTRAQICQKGFTVPEKRIFNMSLTAMECDCGTVTCLGGFVYLLKHGLSQESIATTSNYVYAGRSPVLNPLYFPPFTPTYSHLTPLEVAAVTRHFLTTGRVDWHMRHLEHPRSPFLPASDAVGA